MTHLRSLVVIGLVSALGACTTLGPMPATTGLTAVPQARPGVEVTGAITPGFFLSDAAIQQSGANGNVIGTATLLVEPDRIVGVPGLVVGARAIGNGDDTLVEPFAGYRRRPGGPDGDVSLAAFVYGTHARSPQGLASYRATRVGGEVAVDARVLQMASWLALHAQAAVSATAIAASGTYCVDSAGLGVDCDTSTNAHNDVVSASLSGVFPAATGTLAFDLGEQHRALHLVRIAIVGTVGAMPQLRGGVQQSDQAFAQVGLQVTWGLGAPD